MRTQHRTHSLDAGYTLLEVLVTMAIMGIFSGLLFNGFVIARRGAALRNASEVFASHLRETAAFAQNGIRDPVCLGTAGVDPKACAHYRVTMVAGSGTFTRETTDGIQRFGTATYTLPEGMVFRDAGSIEFQYRPPVVEATFVGATPGAYALNPLGVSSPSLMVCVGPLAPVSVSASSC